MMNSCLRLMRPTVWLVILLWVGCERRPAGKATEASKGAAAKSAAMGPESSAIKPVLDEGWCSGHGVPESVCTRCHDKLIAKFKEAGDWCKEHDLPESQCTKCHPEIAARWAALDPNKPDDGTKDAPAPTSKPGAAAPIERDPWCFEHGVPKNVCTRCDATLIPKFKEAHDWCNEHGVPESQCVKCNPDCRARWEAMKPRASREELSGGSPIVVERSGRTSTLGDNDPLCQIERSQIRFRDASVARQAGIEVAAVRPRRMSASIDVPAEVEFDATRLTRIIPRVPGVAREVRAGLGDAVQPGDILAVLDSAVLGEAKSQLIERQQDLRVAEAAQRRAATIFDGVQRLLSVATASASSSAIHEELEGVPLGEARAKLLRAHAELRLARFDAARQTQLFADKITPEKEVQAANATLAAAEAEFLALREEIAFNAERDRLVADRGLQVAKSALEAADRRLHILGLSDEQIAAVGSEGSEALSRYELRSPAAGSIIERHISAGEMVDGASPLFVTADPAHLWLLAGVYEKDLPALKVGLPVQLTVDGLPGGGFQGRLTWISSQVDDKTRLVPVRGEISNDDGLLRARMYGQARIILRENADVLSVPAEAVQSDGCCQLAFVLEADDVFTPRKVRLGASAGGFVEVQTGLREGEMIATAGTFLLKTEILKGSIGAGCCAVETGR